MSRLSVYALADCDGHQHRGRTCQQERKRMLASLKSGKPTGYTWRMWHDPKAGWPKPVATGPMRVPAWAYPTAAYKRDVPYSEEQEMRRVERIQDYFAARENAA